MLSIRLNPQAEKELKEIAKFEGVSVSDYVRKIINENCIKRHIYTLLKR